MSCPIRPAQPQDNREVLRSSTLGHVEPHRKSEHYRQGYEWPCNVSIFHELPGRLGRAGDQQAICLESRHPCHGKSSLGEEERVRMRIPMQGAYQRGGNEECQIGRLIRHHPQQPSPRPCFGKCSGKRLGQSYPCQERTACSSQPWIELLHEGRVPSCCHEGHS